MVRSYYYLTYSDAVGLKRLAIAEVLGFCLFVYVFVCFTLKTNSIHINIATVQQQCMSIHAYSTVTLFFFFFFKQQPKEQPKT